MNNLNSILIDGNLVKDPDLRETPNGTSVCTFCVASNRYFKRDSQLKQEVSFFDVEAWGGQAMTCSEYLVKGRGVRVSGRLKQERWKDGDGNPRNRIKIVAERVDFKPYLSKEKKEEKQNELNTVAV